jgi:hypothetical protein
VEEQTYGGSQRNEDESGMVDRVREHNSVRFQFACLQFLIKNANAIGKATKSVYSGCTLTVEQALATSSDAAHTRERTVRADPVCGSSTDLAFARTRGQKN